MTFPDRCISKKNGAVIAIREGGKRFELTNGSRVDVEVIKVDGCAITEGERCDFVIRAECGREVFIELKGSDIAKAVRQIKATISLLSVAAGKDLRVGVVVANRVPAEDSSTMIAKAALLRSSVGKLFVRSREFSVELASL